MLWLCRSPVPCYVTGWYLVFDVATLTDILLPDPDMYTPVLAILYLLFDIWYRYLPCYAYYLISDTGSCHAMLITWYLIPVLAMLYLLFDIWYRYLPCYTYYLISDTGTCHASLDTWHTATWYQYTWPDIVTPDWILLHRTPYFFAYSWLSLLRGLDYYTVTRHSVLLYSCIPKPLKKGDFWYYTPVDPRNRIIMNIGLL